MMKSACQVSTSDCNREETASLVSHLQYLDHSSGMNCIDDYLYITIVTIVRIL